MAATAHPRVGAGLWPVGHSELTKLNVTESTMPVTDQQRNFGVN
jgi:hypothetical protein